MTFVLARVVIATVVKIVKEEEVEVAETVLVAIS